MTILDTIVAQKRVEVAHRKERTSIQELQKWPFFNRQPLSATRALTNPNSSGIIAEFKRKSPSKGVLNEYCDASSTTEGYVRAGAACLSILTDGLFFGGTVYDLALSRTANPATPILRKDFVIDSYQIIEAKAIGADFILLIAACLEPAQIKEFTRIAHSLGLEVLLEVHTAEELETHLVAEVDMVGVNNRNLKTFHTDVQTSVDLFGQIPDRFVKVSESGLSNSNTLLSLKQVGYQGFLIGETFMKTPSPERALRNLVRALNVDSLAFQ